MPGQPPRNALRGSARAVTCIRIAAILLLGIPVSIGAIFVPAACHAATQPYVWKQQDMGPAQITNAIWGSSAKDVFGVGASGNIIRCDWSACRPQVSGTFDNLYAVWGTSTNDIYAVGDGGTIVHYDGSAWRSVALRIALGCDFRAVWGSSPTDVYIAGKEGAMGLSEPALGERLIPSGTVFHYDGTRWTRQRLGENVGTVTALWGSSANDVYAGTAGGVILHSDGSTWRFAAQLPIQSPALMLGQFDLQTLWGTSTRNLFVAGMRIINQGADDTAISVIQTVLLHYDGETWTFQPNGERAMAGIGAVWVNSPEDIFVVGPGSELMHFDGTDWVVLTAPVPVPAYRIWAAPTGEVVIIGHAGTIFWGRPQW